MDVKDSNGNVTVQLIKDLDVKGASVTLKRGTTIKNTRLTSNDEEIECRVEKVKGLVLVNGIDIACIKGYPFTHIAEFLIWLHL